MRRARKQSKPKTELVELPFELRIFPILPGILRKKRVLAGTAINYLERLPESVSRLEQALNHGDWEQVQLLAVALKSGTLYGYEVLSSTLNRLLGAAKDQKQAESAQYLQELKQITRCILAGKTEVQALARSTSR